MSLEEIRAALDGELIGCARRGRNGLMDSTALVLVTAHHHVVGTVQRDAHVVFMIGPAAAGRPGRPVVRCGPGIGRIEVAIEQQVDGRNVRLRDRLRSQFVATAGRTGRTLESICRCGRPR